MSTLNIAASVLVFVIGIFVSVILKDWTWFARSGALVTAVELFIALKRVRFLLNFDRMEEHLAAFQRTRPLLEFPQQTEAKKAQRELSVSQLAEIWILMAGTLILGLRRPFGEDPQIGHEPSC